MKLIKGQRWRWDNHCNMTILETSEEFIRTEQIKNSRWYFGRSVQNSWILLKNQDVPNELL